MKKLLPVIAAVLLLGVGVYIGSRRFSGTRPDGSSLDGRRDPLPSTEGQRANKADHLRRLALVEQRIWRAAEEGGDAFLDALSPLTDIRIPETVRLLEKVAIETGNPYPFHLLGKLQLLEAEAVLLRWSGQSENTRFRKVASFVLLQHASEGCFDTLWKRYEDANKVGTTAPRMTSFMILARRSRELQNDSWRQRLNGEVNRLRSHLFDETRHIGRKQVLTAIGELDSHQSVGILLEAIAKDKSVEVRKLAANYLTRSKDPVTTRRIQKFVSETQDPARRALAQGILNRRTRK